MVGLWLWGGTGVLASPGIPMVIPPCFKGSNQWASSWASTTHSG